jgi:hypothetical protein
MAVAEGNVVSRRVVVPVILGAGPNGHPTKEETMKLLHIGKTRRALFMPFQCRWNAWVRDWTAALQRTVPWLI